MIPMNNNFRMVQVTSVMQVTPMLLI